MKLSDLLFQQLADFGIRQGVSVAGGGEADPSTSDQ